MTSVPTEKGEAMTDREKLIELLKVDSCTSCGIEACYECVYSEYDDCYTAITADRLIAHGVVVREKGENLNADTPSLFGCSKCGWCCWDTYTSDTGKFNFCPNCGADMRKGENDA